MHAMRALKAQYFLSFAVMGAVMPYLPLFLADRGLSRVEVGWVIATTGVAVLITPVLLTLLADLRLESRTLLACTFVVSVLGLTGMLGSHAFWPLLLTHLLYAVAVFPVMPLQDGLNFSLQAKRREAGRAEVPYHHIRVWGTVGFIVPSLILWAWMTLDDRVSLTLTCAIGFSLAALGNTFLLPQARGPAAGASVNNGSEDRRAPGLYPRDGVEGVAPARAQTRLPTVAAMRTLATGPTLAFAIAAWLANVSVAAYYAFYPIYLKEVLGIDAKWTGLISSLGVVIEILFILAFGVLVRKLGLRWLMALGAATIALRFLLFAMYPTILVAVGTQVLHGMLVLVVHVAPPIYLNQRASPAYRHSIQGLYAMAVVGTGRITGNVLSGYVAEGSLITVFAAAAGVAAVSAVLFAAFFREETQPARG